MRILPYLEAVAAISSVPEYLNLLNSTNLAARGCKSVTELMTRRKNAVVDLYERTNRVYLNALRAQCEKYTRYRRYLQYNGIVLSDGSDEQRASHCCGNNIVFTIPMMGALDSLFPHEVWHIISRQLPINVRDKMAAIFNIHPAVFYIPNKLRSVLLINPDNLNMYYYHLVDGYQIVLLPIIKNNRMFDVTLAFVINDGMLYQLDEDQATHMKQHISAVCGTTYISGMDEVLADNFSNFSTGEQSTRNKKLVAAIPLD